MSTRKINYNLDFQVKQVLLTILVILGGSMSFAQQPSLPLPRVVSANVPFYPPLPRVIGVQGSVRIKISTNGTNISAIHAESGPEQLAKSAIENIKTWKFKDHTPTTFEVTFKYILSPEAECPQDNDEVVVLQLPSEVKITAKRVKECDPIVH